MRFAKQNLFENERQTQFYVMLYEKYSCLNSTFQIENIKLTCETSMDETTLKPIKNKKYEFNDEIQNHTFNDEQLQNFELLIKQPIGLHILEGTFGSGIYIYIYITQYLHIKIKMYY
jgi:hypothetical protein